MSRLFGKFVQFDPAKMQQGGGSGLGLWLTRSIMERHGGGIGARSDGVPGNGTTFFLDLPLYSLQKLDSRGQFVPDRMLLLSTVPEESGHGSIMGRVKSILAMRSSESDSSSHGYGTKIDSKVESYASGADIISSGGAPIDTVSRWENYEQQQFRQNEALAQSIMLVKQGTSLRGSFSGLSRQDVNIPVVKSSDNSRNSSSRGSSKCSSAATSVRSGELLKDQVGTLATTVAATDAIDTSVADYSAFGSKTVHQIPLIAPSSRICVMIVDDMTSNRKVLRRAVTRSCPNVVCSEYNDGIDALEAVSKSLSSRPPRGDANADDPVYYDIIFMDCQMGVMDGPVACKKMRTEHGYTGHIYGVSGDARAADTFKEAGANGGYTKPMKIDDIKQILSGGNFA